MKFIKLISIVILLNIGFVVGAQAVEMHENHEGHEGHHFGHHFGDYAHDHNVPAVPEAETWAMMAVGLGLVGMRLRRKNKSL